MEFVAYLFIFILVVILIKFGDANPISLYDSVGNLGEPELIDMPKPENKVRFNEERMERFTFDEGHVDTVGRVSTAVKRPLKSILKRTHPTPENQASIAV